MAAVGYENASKHALLVYHGVASISIRAPAARAHARWNADETTPGWNTSAVATQTSAPSGATSPVSCARRPALDALPPDIPAAFV